MTTSLTDDEHALKLKEEGNKAFREKRYHAAVKSYTESLEVQPDFVVFGNRAQTYICLGLCELALRDVNEAIRLSNTYAKNFHRRAKILTKLGLYELARSDYQRVLELNGAEKEKEAAAASLVNLRGRVNARSIELRQWECGDEFEYSEMIKIPIADHFPAPEPTATIADHFPVPEPTATTVQSSTTEYEWPSESESARSSASALSSSASVLSSDRTSNSSFSSTLSNTLPPYALAPGALEAVAAHADATDSLPSSSASVTSSEAESCNSAQPSSHNTTFELLSGSEDDDDDAFISADTTATRTREAMEESTTVVEVPKKITVDDPTVAKATVHKETAAPSMAPVAGPPKETTTVPKRRQASLRPPLNFADFALHHRQLEPTPALFAEYFLAIPPATYPSVFANLFQNDHLETLIDGYQLLLGQGSITTTAVADSLIGLSYLPRFHLLPMFMGDKERQNALNLIDKLPPDVATFLRSAFD